MTWYGFSMSDSLRDHVGKFLTFHFGDSPQGMISLFRVPLGTQLVPISAIDQAVDVILAHRESANIYFGMAARREGTRKRGGKADCSSVRTLWLDIDVGTVGHRDSNLPPSVEAVAPLLSKMEINPSCIVQSGGGLHVYYRLDKSFLLETKEDIQRFETLNKAILNRFLTLCEKQGWSADPQGYTVERILRVPFTFNFKDGGQRPVILEGYDDVQYTFEELEEFFLDTVKGLRKKLSRVRNLQTQPIAKRILAGESLAPAGQRDKELHRACSLLAFLDPDSEPEQLAEVLRPCLEHWANESDAERSIDEELEKATEKIARSQIAGKEARVTAIDDRDHSTDGEIAQWAKDQDCTVQEFQRRWVIQKASAYYVFCNGKYTPPLCREELECALPQYLAPAGDHIEWTRINAQGNVVSRSAKEVAARHGTVAQQVIADLTITNSYFDAKTSTFFEAVCPQRDIRPQFDPEIDRWLRLLGGTDAEKLLDWIATVGDLTRQTCALYIGGAPGTGKTMLAHGLARIWSTGSPSSLSNLLQGFNHDLARCPLVFADEKLPSRFKGDSVTGDLREMIGSSSRPWTRKYLPNAELRGAIRLMITANNDHLLAIGEQDFGADDLEAIAGRFLHVESTATAREYLESIGGRAGTDGWVDGDIIASHALWLHANREVTPGKRFLVEGRMGKMHETLATSGKWPGLVCEWLCAYLLDDANKGRIAEGVRLDGDGNFLVNTPSLAKNWAAYHLNQTPPSMQLLGRALNNISSDERVTLDGKQYRKVDVERLLNWAERIQFGDIDRMRQKVNAKVIYPAKESKSENY
jgi:hypothetical protein